MYSLYVEGGSMAKRIKLLVLAAIMLIGAGAVSGLGSSAHAQPPRGRGGRAPRVIVLQEMVIEGRVQKPNAFYILNRSNLGYEVLDLRTSFVREIVRSVQHDPF